MAESEYYLVTYTLGYYALGYSGKNPDRVGSVVISENPLEMLSRTQEYLKEKESLVEFSLLNFWPISKEIYNHRKQHNLESIAVKGEMISLLKEDLQPVGAGGIGG